MRKMFKITVLSDNQKLDDTLESEHGLCILLETGNIKVLLDTGASGLFMKNAERLGVDIQDVDYVFISHGHADHIGGLIPFLEMNVKAKVLLSKKNLNQGFFSMRNGEKNIGIDLDFEKYWNRCLFLEGDTQLNDTIRVFPCDLHSFTNPKANTTLFKDSGQGLVPDDFNHELVFCCGTDKLFVYTGCAHKGLLNILCSVQQVTGKMPGIVFGGFHLLDSRPGQFFETESEIEQIGAYLKKNFPETLFFTGHCTGTNTFRLLKSQLHEQIETFYTGYTTQI